MAAIGIGCDGADESAPPQATVYMGLLGTIPAVLEMPPDAPEYLRGLSMTGVVINDYDLVRQMFDIPLPGPGDGEYALWDYTHYLPAMSETFDGENHPAVRADVLFGPFSGVRNIMTHSFQYFAFDFRDMDQSIMAWPRTFNVEVIRGRFDP